MISVNNLSVFFADFGLFENVTFNIGDRDRIGLAGKNGAGKSTMLKTIAGLQRPTSGTINIPKDTKIGYLPQHMKVEDLRSVFEEAEMAMAEVKTLEAEIEKMNQELATRTDYETQAYMDFLQDFTDKTERLEMLGGSNYKAQIETTLKGLGFEREDFNRNTAEFSGGWRMRIELAKILLSHPDVFLLDEPTNHLDIESIQWLENFLKDYSGAVVIISHDRAFLDNLTTRTIEIVLGKIYDYKANYSKYLELRQERFEQQMNAYKNQQKMIEDTKKFIERFRYQATKAVQVQQRVKQLEKVEVIQVDDFDRSALHIKFPPAPHSGAVTIRGRQISKNYGDHQVLKEIDFEVERGEKIAFVGRNGEGKSTMAKIIMNEIDHEGTITLASGVKIGYFAQNQADLLNPEDTVFDTIDRVAVGDIRTKIRDLLGAFLFSGEDIDKKVSVLSGGERTRLAMVRLLLTPVNLLVLDEPTNHLDLRSKDILKKALNDYDGTVVVVSHDREFLDGLVSRVYEFRNKKMKEHIGGIYEFLEDKRIENLRELEVPKVTKPPKTEKVETKTKNLSYEQQKAIEREKSKKQKQIQASERKIEELEARIKDLETAMNTETDHSKVNTMVWEHSKLSEELQKEMDNWERLNS